MRRRPRRRHGDDAGARRDQLVAMMFGTDILAVAEPPDVAARPGRAARCDGVTIAERAHGHDRPRRLRGRVRARSSGWPAWRAAASARSCGHARADADLGVAGSASAARTSRRATYRAFLGRRVSDYLPAGRLEEGLVSGLTLTEHLALATGDGRLRASTGVAPTEEAAGGSSGYSIRGRPRSRRPRRSPVATSSACCWPDAARRPRSCSWSIPPAGSTSSRPTGCGRSSSSVARAGHGDHLRVGRPRRAAAATATASSSSSPAASSPSRWPRATPTGTSSATLIGGEGAGLVSTGR